MEMGGKGVTGSDVFSLKIGIEGLEGKKHG